MSNFINSVQFDAGDMVELTSFTTGAEITDIDNIQVGYRSLKYSGECTYSYTPNALISVDANTLYTDDPEAVVERYMKNFDDAMTNSDFSYIENCLLPGSSIYLSMRL